MADPTGVIFGHDVSHHQDSIDVGRLAGRFIIARTAQAKGGKYAQNTIDRMYPTHKANAQRAGKHFASYFYLGDGLSAAANAALHASIEPDRTIPVMLDWEEGSGNVAFLRACTAAFTALGYRVILTYAPSWYLTGAGGGGSLAGLPPLVSSKYPDMAPGDVVSEYRDESESSWNGYGGNTVAILQFTSTGRDAAYPGIDLDTLAFKGTEAQLTSLFGSSGGGATPARPTIKEDDPVQVPAGTNEHFSDLVPAGATQLFFATGYNDALTIHQFDFWGATDNAKDPKGTGNGVGGGFGTIKIDPNRPGPLGVKIPAGAVMYNFRYTANHAFGIGWK